jgi:hypothetical protein
MGNRDLEVVGKSVDHCSPNAAAGRAAGHHERIRSQIDEIAGERCPEERAGVLLGEQDVILARCDLRDELVALGRDRWRYIVFSSSAITSSQGLMLASSSL